MCVVVCKNHILSCLLILAYQLNSMHIDIDY